LKNAKKPDNNKKRKKSFFTPMDPGIVCQPVGCF